MIARSLDAGPLGITAQIWRAWWDRKLRRAFLRRGNRRRACVPPLPLGF
jgi:hypothetical protein